MHERAAFLLLEQPRSGVGGVERAHQVDFDDLLESIDAHAMEDHIAQDAGVVHNTVELAEDIDGLLDDLAGGNCFRHRLEVGDGGTAAA